MHGAGFTGSGERYLQSVVGMEATAEGRVRILASSTEIGQGTNTILPQIAADDAGHCRTTQVEIAQPDTADVPNSGPTVASRTCMVVGKLVESAALGSAADAGRAASPETFAEVRAATTSRATARCAASASTRRRPAIFWDDETYQGDAYGAYAWAVYVAEVSVDTRHVRGARRGFRGAAGGRAR